MLAPVLDSLIRFFESAIRRPLTVGFADALTSDEQMLVEILQDDADRKPQAPADASPFRWAVWSSRIMIRKVIADALHIRARGQVALV